MIQRIIDNGIHMDGSFVFGFDNEDASIFERTLEFVIKIRLSAATFSILTPFPGTKLMEKLVRETAPQIGIVSASYHANGEVGLMAVEAGLHVLLETPIAHKLGEADAIIAAAEQLRLKIEIAEQFHRRPLEQIKLKLIESGLFGRVHPSFNDFAGHGYHGVSVLRSYLGFNAKPVQVSGAVREYDLAAHWSRLAGTHGERRETQEHGIIEFEGGQLGIFHWTDVGYDSPLRWWRSSRFLAEKGMGITTGVGLDVQERLSLLSPGAEAPDFITLERRWERVDGGALIAMVAHTGDPVGIVQDEHRDNRAGDWNVVHDHSDRRRCRPADRARHRRRDRSAGSSQVIAQLAAAAGMSQAAQRPVFELANALTRQSKFLSYFFQCVRFITIQSETQTYDSCFPWRKRG